MIKKLLLIFGVLLLLLGATLLIAGSLQVTVSSVKFKATARIKVIPSTGSTLNRPAFGRQPQQYIDPGFVRQEIERLQSAAVLYQVITNLDLVQAWGAKPGQKGGLSTEATFARLKSQLEIRPGRDAGGIDINAYSDDKAEVADLANNVATVFRDTRVPSSPRRVELIALAQTPESFTHTKRPQGQRLIALGILPTIFGLVLAFAGLLVKKPMPVPPQLASSRQPPPLP